MPGFDGTGPNGMGPMTGGGRGFCNPQRGGGVRQYARPRRGGYAFPRRGVYGFSPLAPQVNRGQELELLKSQAEALRNELKELDAEIGKLSAGQE